MDGMGLPYPTGPCDPGYYCNTKAYTSAPPDGATGGLCPRGGYCPVGSSYPTACDPGKYNNFTGGKTQADCYACDPGYYCSGTNLPYPTGCCKGGYYCTGGATTAIQYPVQPGHFSSACAYQQTECYPGTFQQSAIQERTGRPLSPTRSVVNMAEDMIFIFGKVQAIASQFK